MWDQSRLRIADSLDRWGWTEGLTRRLVRDIRNTEKKASEFGINTDRQRTAIAEAVLAYADTKTARPLLERVSKEPIIFSVVDVNASSKTNEPASDMQLIIAKDMRSSSTGDMVTTGLAAYTDDGKGVVAFRGELLPTILEEKFVLGIDKPSILEMGQQFHHEILHLDFYQKGFLSDIHHEKIARIINHVYLRENGYVSGFEGGADFKVDRLTPSALANIPLTSYVVVLSKVRAIMRHNLETMASMVGNPDYDKKLLSHLKRIPVDVRNEYERWLAMELQRAGTPEPSRVHLIPE